MSNNVVSISLRPICRQDTDNIVRWRNSYEVKRQLFSQEDISAESHLRYFDSVIASGSCRQFIIEDSDMGAVGTVFLKDIDTQKSCAEFGIFIGEPDARGRGIGKRATALMLEYGFISLNLKEIRLYVFADNTAAVKAYLAVGFWEQERFKKERQGTAASVVSMLVKRDDYIASNP